MCLLFGYFVERGGGSPESSAECCGYQASPFFGYFAKGPEEVLRSSAECCGYQASPAFRLFLLKGAEDVLNLQRSVVVIRRLQFFGYFAKGAEES